MNIIKKVTRDLARVEIVSAVTWAAVMIACAIILKGSEGNQNIFYILLTGATTHFLLLSSISTKLKKYGKDNNPELA